MLADLKPPPRNVRMHPEKQITELARAVEKFGQIRPVVIDENNMILAGNGLVQALNKLNHEQVEAYRVSGLSERDKKRLMLSDNKLFSLGLDDHTAILETLREFDGEGFDIPGFDDEVLNTLFSTLDTVTADALLSYGILEQQAVTAAQEREVPVGTTAASGAAAHQHSEAACPACGHTFPLRE